MWEKEFYVFIVCDFCNKCKIASILITEWNIFPRSTINIKIRDILKLHELKFYIKYIRKRSYHITYNHYYLSPTQKLYNTHTTL